MTGELDWERKYIGIDDVTLLNHTRGELEQLSATDPYAAVITELANVVTDQEFTEPEVEAYVDESDLFTEEY